MREWLRSMRIEKNFTMKEMGERLNISESYYCAIENGDRQKKMDITLAYGLAEIFSVPIAEIVAREQDSQSSA